MLKPFDKWAENFQKRKAYIYSDLNGDLKKEPKSVHNVLAELKEDQVVRGSADLLRRNALYACYQATFAINPDTGARAKERQAFIESHRLLGRHIQVVESVLAYLTKYRDIPRQAMSAAHKPPGSKWPVTQVTPRGSETLEELRRLLQRYRTGLGKLPEPRLFYFPHGPLEITVSSYRWPHDYDIRQIGLMFHLSYLFRYFTTKNLPFDLDIRDVGNGLLEISGPMLEGGDPRTDLIAPLVNATFGTTFKAKKIRDLLHDLSRRTKGARFSKRPQFLGWELSG